MKEEKYYDQKNNEGEKSENEYRKDVILNIGAEGGSITLSRIIEKNHVSFVINKNEFDLEDNFYPKENCFDNLDEAVKYIYLKYPILDLYLLKVDPNYILPIAKIIRVNILLRNHDYDPVEAKKNDREFEKNLKNTNSEIWKELKNQVSLLRELLVKEISSKKSDKQITDQAIHNLHEQVHLANIVNPFNWPAWDEGKWLLKAKGTDFQSLDVITLCKLVTTIVRSDRFCDGEWNASIKDGSMLKILDAIIQKNLP